MGAFVGLTLALGVLLLILSVSSPTQHAHRRGRLQALIDSAALPQATPSAVLSVAAAGAIICGAAVLLVTSVHRRERFELRGLMRSTHSPPRFARECHYQKRSPTSRIEAQQPYGRHSPTLPQSTESRAHSVRLLRR